MDFVQGSHQTRLLNNNNNQPLKTPSETGQAFNFDTKPQQCNDRDSIDLSSTACKMPLKSSSPINGEPSLNNNEPEQQEKVQSPAWPNTEASKQLLADLKMPEALREKPGRTSQPWSGADLGWPSAGGRPSPSVEEFWKEVPPPMHYSMGDVNSLHHPMAGMDTYPYSTLNQMYTSLHPGLAYGSNLQHWRETGYPLGGGGFWRRGGMPYADCSALSRDSSRDDLTSVDDRIFDFEDRFRVDRRKLELMVLGRFDPIKETAADYFQRIGEETNTTVIWPSRIKIGAKSKKDPHIRVGGLSEETVQKAKAMIMEFLDTKTSRVTMKMDVSYTDHSHVIGKGGNTIRRVMSETNCHVHFPDSNRSNPNEKSNQVSIAGEMEGVENARARVRELTPLIFFFDLPIIPNFETSPDPHDPCIRAIQDQYNIQVTFRQKQKNFHTTVVVVKGCEWEAARVKEATLLLIERFYCNNPNPTGTGPMNGNPVANIPVSMNMEISPVHHGVVLGKGNMNLRTIMQKTKTTILFPDASDPNIPSIRKGSVTISGSINNVYLTRQLLVGSLPLVMMFDLPDHLEVCDSEVQKLQDELDLSISIKPKQRQAHKSVMIKAQERNASGMYIARHKVLALEGEPLKADIPETYKLHSAANFFMNSQEASPIQNQGNSLNNSGYLPYQNVSPFLLQNFANIQAAGLAGLAGLNQNCLYPSAASNLFGNAPASAPLNQPCFDQQIAGTNGVNPYLSGIIPTSNNWMPPNGAFGNILPPNHPYLQDYALRVLNHITNLQQIENQTKLSKSGLLDAMNNNNYLAAGESPPLKGNSPRNSSPVHDDIGNLTNQLDKLEMNETGKFFDLNQNSANVGILRSSISSMNGGSSPGSSSNGHSLQNKSPTCSFSESGNGREKVPDLGQMFLDQLTDRRAPGCEKKTLQLAAQTQMDYDQKKLLATKAIQTKPTGEPRTPTPSWSGLGFSNSMPESVIRENLEMSDLDGSGGNGGGKRPNLTIFPSLMNVREETDEEVAKSNEKSQSHFSTAMTSQTPKTPACDAVNSPQTSASQTFFRPGWFGNSSAFDMLTPTSLESNDRNTILPTDDLPNLFARQGLAKYSDVFLRHEVDLATFATLTEQDLKEIGIQTFGARKKLLLLANKVKQAGSHKW